METMEDLEGTGKAELLVQVEWMDFQDLQELQEQEEVEDHPVSKERMDRQDPEEMVGQKVQKDRSEHLVQQDPMALVGYVDCLAELAPRVHKVFPARLVMQAVKELQEIQVQPVMVVTSGHKERKESEEYLELRDARD